MKHATIFAIAILLVGICAAVFAFDVSRVATTIFSVAITPTAFGVYAGYRWVQFYREAPSAIHDEQQKTIRQIRNEHATILHQLEEKQRKIVQEKDERIRNLEAHTRRPEHDMNGSDVLVYLKACFETQLEIEDALSVSALNGKITVEAMPLRDRRWVPVPKDVFSDHTFFLSPSNIEIARELDFPYDEDRAKMGGDIRAVDWDRNNLKIGYECPRFCRAQIELNWPLENKSDFVTDNFP